LKQQCGSRCQHRQFVGPARKKYEPMENFIGGGFLSGVDCTKKFKRRCGCRAIDTERGL
jgi:hypothetical protein